MSDTALHFYDSHQSLQPVKNTRLGWRIARWHSRAMWRLTVRGRCNLLGSEEEQCLYFISSQKRKSEGSLLPTSLTSLSLHISQSQRKTPQKYSSALCRLRCKVFRMSPGPLGFVRHSAAWTGHRGLLSSRAPCGPVQAPALSCCHPKQGLDWAFFLPQSIFNLYKYRWR